VRPFLVTASPRRAIGSLPASRRTAIAPAPSSPATTGLIASGGGVLRLPPRSDLLPALLSAVACGPTLVVVPSLDEVSMIAARLRRANVSVAVMPDDWAQAAGGVDVVIGTRSTAWAPCADMSCAVVVDEHDEALQEERAPTWHARDVVAERCRRAGVPCVMISPVPTLNALEWYAGEGVVHPPRVRERAGWPAIAVVDRRDEEPWRRSLVTPALIERLRDPNRRVLCVSNITGRARVLACRSCRALIRCERCDAAVGLTDDRRLECRRCGVERPAVCQACGAAAFANLRPGVTRLREELEAAAARPVAALTADATADTRPDPRAGIVVGTEALLHRSSAADVVAFLEFDSEMLAPRFRAAEQSLALLVRAGRLAPEVLVQTFVPDHPVLRAARSGDPDIVADIERDRRRQLRLPPFGALALVSGSGAADVIAQLATTGGQVEVGETGDGSRFLVRSVDWTTLGRTLNAAERPAGLRVRVEVDPARV
jgi:primosomal protein N' (replication factor Y)